MKEGLSRRDFLRGTVGGALVTGLVAAEAAENGAKALPRRVLGKTGVRVPILAMGTAPAGTRTEDKDAIALYHEAIDQGVNYMDTAPDFAGYGRAQLQLGQVLKDRRKEVFLVTKTFTPDGDAARKLLERNLKELQTDHADLVYVHSLGADEMDPKKALGPKGTLRALLQAREEGLTRFVGLSGHSRPMRFVEALREHDVDVIMNAVNFVDRHTYDFETKVWPLAAQKKVGLVAMKVYGGQRRDGCYMPKEHVPMALRYALSLPNVATAVIGMATKEELRQNLAWARSFQPLTAEERAKLEKLGREMATGWGAHFGPVT
jgi:aryl-alcohol dehydrogenase-like predicted oxidoreductase